MEKASPKRKKLSHDVPPWVQEGARYFITINCKQRGTDILSQASIADALMESAVFYEGIGRWYLWLLVIMPDHLHFIASFSFQHGIRRTVGDWKRYHSNYHKIDWQSDFFEHRLRNDAEYEEKAFYVRMNPVRKGLVERYEEWLFQLDRGSPGGLALANAGLGI